MSRDFLDGVSQLRSQCPEEPSSEQIDAVAELLLSMRRNDFATRCAAASGWEREQVDQQLDTLYATYLRVEEDSKRAVGELHGDRDWRAATREEILAKLIADPALLAKMAKLPGGPQLVAYFNDNSTDGSLKLVFKQGEPDIVVPRRTIEGDLKLVPFSEAYKEGLIPWENDREGRGRTTYEDTIAAAKSSGFWIPNQEDGSRLASACIRLGFRYLDPDGSNRNRIAWFDSGPQDSRNHLPAIEFDQTKGHPARLNSSLAGGRCDLAGTVVWVIG